MRAFALSFDEVIVTTFTAGQRATLPIWMLEELVRPRQRPVTNVVAMVVLVVTFLPILGAYYLTRGGAEPAGRTSRGETKMETELLIGGRMEQGAEAADAILNPRTGAAVAEVPEASPAQVEAAVAAAREAFEGWDQVTEIV